jgi:hypothetical protein
MKRTISILAAAAVILYLPESNRLDLLTVAAVAYGCAFFLIRQITAEVNKVSGRRQYLRSLRWVRRNPPALVDMQGRTEYPVVYEEPGYILFEQIRKGA